MTTEIISEAAAAAHECDYRAKEAEDAVRDWHATSDPVKRAILQDAAATMRFAQRALSQELNRLDERSEQTQP